jgi:acetyltransferase-like isoleucine patch superfamily enzyme
VRLQCALAGVKWGSGWRLYGLPIIQKHRQSTLTIGARLNLRSTVRSNPLGPNHPVILSTRRPGASLTIGDDFGMTGGSIVCEERIAIGQRVTVGANTTIVDTDFHPLDPSVRQQNPTDGGTALVIIEDDVFIGMNTLVLKGVTIGHGSVIGAGSVVTRDIPPGVIAAGNPAQVIKPL